jgi:hypothetical protein
MKNKIIGQNQIRKRYFYIDIKIKIKISIFKLFKTD